MWLPLVVILIGLFYLWLRKRYIHFKHFERLGVPGPKPSIFSGNFDIIAKYGVGAAHLKWVDTYGPICGYFYGYHPVVLVTDTELMRSIMIKDAVKFVDRELFIPARILGDSRMKTSISFQKGNEWKNTRAMLSPCFSTSNLKRVLPHILKEVDTFLEVLSKLPSKDIPISPLFERFTLATVYSVCLGQEMGVQNPDPNKFRDAFLSEFNLKLSDFYIFFVINFPGLHNAIQPVEKFLIWVRHVCNPNGASMSYIMDYFTWYIKARLTSNKEWPDIAKPVFDHFKLSGKENDPKEIDALASNILTFVMAGFDTLGITMTQMLRFLAIRQDIQDELREEVVQVLGDKEELDYEGVSRLRKVLQVMNETLRLFPASKTVVTRVASENVRFGNWEFPAGTVFQIPVEALHRLPDLWDDPETFDPARFDPGNKPDSLYFQPFGAGPRQCIGIRLARVEFQAFFAKMLRKFRIKPSKKMVESKMEPDDGPFVTRIKGGIYIDLEPL